MDLMVWIHIKCMTALFGKNFKKICEIVPRISAERMIRDLLYRI